MFIYHASILNPYSFYLSVIVSCTEMLINITMLYFYKLIRETSSPLGHLVVCEAKAILLFCCEYVCIFFIDNSIMSRCTVPKNSIPIITQAKTKTWNCFQCCSQFIQRDPFSPIHHLQFIIYNI